jgi:hypothetical protein
VPDPDHDAACMSCDATVQISGLCPAEGVALLRSFFVQHEGCRTSIDVSCYARLGMTPTPST